MKRSKNYIGDGLSFYNAVSASGIENEEIQRLMGVSNGTFYRLYKQVSFTDEYKELAAKALGKSVDEIFGATMTEGDKMRRRKAIGKPDAEDELGLIYVPIAAQAGYSRNFEDPVFVNQLERLYIPGLPYKGDRYRYFDVEGDSMEPTLEEGMQVIGEQVYQEDWKHISDFYIYVIIKINKVLIKRLFKKDERNFVMISDNEIHPQEPLKAEDIKELWLVKRKLDWRMTPPKRFEITV